MKLHKSIINLKIIFYRYIIVEIKGYRLTDRIIYIGSYIMKVKKKTFEWYNSHITYRLYLYVICELYWISI